MADSLLDGFEPALKAAMQRVVVQWLPVGPVRALRDRVTVDDKAAVAAEAVAAAVFQIVVGGEVVPERTQGAQFVKIGRAHV